MYVYKITNNINGKAYIGITKDTKLRWAQHINTSSNANHAEYNKVLYRAFRKYSVSNFTFEVIAKGITIPEAKALEVTLIATLGTLVKDNGYNVTPGGDLVEDSRSRKGENSPLAKLTEQQALDIIARRDAGELQQEVFKEYSKLLTFSGGFQSIWSGNSWKHLQPQNVVKRHGNRGLTDSEVRVIRELAHTRTGKSLSEEFGVPTSTISNIINNKTYKDVT